MKTVSTTNASWVWFKSAYSGVIAGNMRFVLTRNVHESLRNVHVNLCTEICGLRTRLKKEVAENAAQDNRGGKRRNGKHGSEKNQAEVENAESGKRRTGKRSTRMYAFLSMCINS